MSSKAAFSPNSSEVLDTYIYIFTGESVGEEGLVAEFFGEDDNGNILRINRNDTHTLYVNGIPVNEDIDYIIETDKLIFTNPFLVDSQIKIHIYKTFQISESVSKQYVHDNFLKKSSIG